MIRRAMLKGHVEDLRAINVTPHVAQKQWPGQNRQAAEKLDRCPHDKARELWGVAEAPQNDRMHLWLGQAAYKLSKKPNKNERQPYDAQPQ